VARGADELLDYTFHPGKKSTYEQQKPPSASELGTEQIPTSTDMERESIPVQVDSPALSRAPKIGPPTPPPQKRRKTSAEGHDQIVQQPLEEVADVNALQAASEEGHGHIVQQLLEKRVDVNAQSGYYGNALQAATG